MIFYTRLSDGSEDCVEGDAEISGLMKEVDDELIKLVGIDKTLELEEKMLRMNGLGCQHNFISGFLKGLDVCRAVCQDPLSVEKLCGK